MNYIKTFFIALLILSSNMILAQNCSVNAGANFTICGTSATLAGIAPGGNHNGSPTWTLVSKPAGAPDPVISNINSYTPDVTGMTFPGNYVFQISQPCTIGTTTNSVTVLAPGEVSAFTAGPDITNVNATTGTVTLNGVVPAGYTASWSAYNIYRWERSSVKTNQNSQFGSPTSASTTFSLIKKADHDIDPAYVVTLRITSINNVNCWYEDTAIVRFVPNPQISLKQPYGGCHEAGVSHFIELNTASPVFSKDYAGSPGSSGNFGTTVTMNVISQPSGANISYNNIWDERVFFNGVTEFGTYKFTLTVTNASGSYTTPELTYNYTGIKPQDVSFLVGSRPEQMMVYSATASGGEVHCNLAGQTTPITFSFTLNPADPVTLTTTVTPSGILPPGGAPSVAVSGGGTSTRNATVTPPSGGWRVGTYRFRVATGNGVCENGQSYYIHISDGNRPDVNVDNITVCYPGSGTVTATVPLPAVYKGVVNSSYFQDFEGRYRLTLVSKPAGAANPVFEPYSNTLFTNTSTTISNLNMQGEYVFKIKADTYTSLVGAFLDKEYACSGTSLEDTFSIFVSTQVNANAGSNFSAYSSATALNGNNPGVASTGTWTLVSKPSGAPDPVITDPSLYNTTITNLTTAGDYTFRWAVATGNCTSNDEVIVTKVSCNANAGTLTKQP